MKARYAVLALFLTCFTACGPGGRDQKPPGPPDAPADSEKRVDYSGLYRVSSNVCPQGLIKDTNKLTAKFKLVNTKCDQAANDPDSTRDCLQQLTSIDADCAAYQQAHPSGANCDALNAQSQKVHFNTELYYKNCALLKETKAQLETSAHD